MLIIEKIIWGISEHLVKDEKGKSSLQDVMISAIIVSRLFRTLLEWLMVVPSHYVSNPNISLRITEVIEETIHVAMAGVESISEKEPPTPVDTNTAELVQLYQLMKEAAENTLIHLFHHIDNFAPRYGVATLTSQINDFPTEEKADFENHHYLSFNNHTIIGFIDLPNEKKVRILIRDPAGKFSWDMNYFYEDDSTDPKVAPPVPTERHSVPSRSTMSSFKSEG
jgi:hypothetical protein